MIERYKVKEIEEIWSEENKLRLWLEIEILTIEGFENLNLVPKGTAEKIREKNIKITPQEVKEREKITNHDVAAFVDVLEEKVGKELSTYIHYGLTSSDLLDTTLSIQMRETLKIVLERIKKLEDVILEKIEENKSVFMAGRTHGMFAEPITLSHKFLSYLSEAKRNEKRLKEAIEEVSFGKLSGSVGNYLHIPTEVEEFVLKKLGLKCEPISTQIIPRDRHVIFIFTLVLIGLFLERIATEIRLLSRTEIGELSEPFERGQKGSSSMPHKKNPIISERICGLSRYLRGSLFPVLENTILWHERDISHSSAERIIFPDVSHVTVYMLDKMISILKNLIINRERIRENLTKYEKELFSQSFLYHFINKGMERSKSYDLVQKSLFEGKIPVEENDFEKLKNEVYSKLREIENKLYKRLK
ncbi:MAG: adenylosuccinate lyase [Candidatus Hydrothermales bacterium]